MGAGGGPAEMPSGAGGVLCRFVFKILPRPYLELESTFRLGRFRRLLHRNPTLEADIAPLAE